MGIFGKKQDEKNNGSAKDSKVKSEQKKTVATKDLYKDDNVSKSASKVSGKSVKTGNAYKILVRPLITEKVTSLSAQGKYVFEVGVNANKIEVAKAVEQVYGIKPLTVNIINMKGKTVQRGRIRGKRKDWRKAIVTLPKGKSITVYEGV